MVQTRQVAVETPSWEHHQHHLFQDHEMLSTEPPGSSFGPTVLNQAAMPMSDVDDTGVVLAGFRDCSEETIRYLVDIEQMSDDDPLIVGLQQHLWQHQQSLTVDHLLTELSTTPSTSSSSSSSSHTAPPSGVETTQSQQTRTCGHDSHMFTDLESKLGQGQSVAMDCTASHSASTNSASLDASCNMDNPHSVVFNLSGSPSEHCHDAEMDSNVLDFMSLAKNNPAIASLTEEILSLLEADSIEQDSELDSCPHGNE